MDVSLRVHPELDTTEEVALVPPGFKLGYDIGSGDAEKLALTISHMQWLNIVALSTHVANRQVRPDLHAEALRSMITFAEQLCGKYRIDADYINIGGGFESRNLLEVDSDLTCFADKFDSLLSNAQKNYTLILEPNRYIACDAAITLARTVTRKTNAGYKWIIVDVGTNTLIPLRSASFDVVPTVLDDDHDFFNVGDLIASSIGVIQQNIKLPKKTKVGDIFAIINTGAYTLSMSEQFVLLRPTVLMVGEDRVMILKEREKEEYFVERIQTTQW
jgi:diaminopimelate decarboxylase